MATGIGQLVDLANLIGAVRGTSSKTTTSGGTSTQTQRRDVDQAGINRIVQRMASGQGGQAAISGAARGAGLYNSTAERMLLNDLNARVAGEVADRTAGTTTTTTTSPMTQTVQQPGIGLSNLLAPMAAASLLRGPMSSMLGLDGGSAAASAATNAATNLFRPDLTFDLASSAAGSALGGAASGIDLSSVIGGPGLASSLGTSMGDFALAPSGLAGALSNIPVLGPLLGGITGGFDDEFGANLGLQGGASMLSAAGLLGPLGFLAAPVLGILSSLTGGLSVVCTALADKGLIDRQEYLAGHKYLATLPEYTRKGYYFWGEPLAKKIESGSKWAIRLSLPFAKQRTKLLAGTAPAWKLPLGLVTKYLGEPACYVLGWALTKLEGERNGLVKAYCSK